MPVNDPNNPLDLRYINTDGDAMGGPLLLQSPLTDRGAATKLYVDRLVAGVGAQLTDFIRRDGSLPMTGPLTLSGAPTNALHASTRAYVDAVAAAVAALMVRLDGSVAMTGLLTLSGAPVNALHAATRGYVDAADALMVLVDGTRAMTGALTLPGLPVNPLEAATKGYVDALPPPPLDTYDAVVAAAGGDYTSIVTACATEAVGAKIYIKSGTYNETANIQMQDGQMLVGENPEDTIIDFGAANRKIVFAGAVTNLMVRDLTVQNSIADYVVDLSGNYATVHNCRITGLAAGFNGVRFAGQYCILSNNCISGFTKAGLWYDAHLGNFNKAFGNTFDTCERGLLTGTDCQIENNLFQNCANTEALIGARSLVVGNHFLSAVAGIRVNGAECTFAGNYIYGTAGIRWEADFDYITVTGNTFEASRVWCNVATVSDCSITGNVFKAGDGVYFDGYNSVISGNVFQGTAFINLPAASNDNCISGNNLQSSTNVPKIVDAGMGNTAKNNAGMDLQSEKDFRRMENTSGGPLVAGDSVVLKAVAAGDEVDTTVAQGDDLVFGMLDENIANAAHGAIQTEGFTAKLKVNGTVAIAIGDLIGTFTAAGIAMKAAAGDMAFAVALEAYAVADSNGVIDAILIKPRKV